jgi:hypothetical protein
MAKAAKPISDDSIDMLGDVKKGKPRRFVLLCKGPNVVSIVVYKKGSVEKSKKEAKEFGSGDFSFGIMESKGVVEGKGPALTLKLARANGFEKEPTTPVKLKQFLSDHADFKSQPVFEIVDKLAELTDDDKPWEPPIEAAAPPTPPADPTPEAAVPPPPAKPKPPPDPASAAYVARLEKFQPQLDAALAGNGPLAALASKFSKPMGEAAKKRQYREAERLLAELEKKFAQAALLTEEWDRQWAEMQPRVQAALQNSAPGAGKLRGMVAYAVDQAAAGEFAKALATLPQLEPLLTAAPAAPPVAAGSG